MPELISFETAPEPVVTGETWTATAHLSEPLQDESESELTTLSSGRPPWMEASMDLPVGTTTPTVEVKVPADAPTESYSTVFNLFLDGSPRVQIRGITVIAARDQFPLRAQKAAESVRAADADHSRRAAVAAQAQRATAAAQSLRATIRPDER